MSERDDGKVVPDANFVAWAQHAIFGIFGIGFLAWAVLVWQAREDVKQMYIEHAGLVKHVEALQQEVDAHREAAAHAQSLQMHAREQQQLDDLQSQVDRRITALQHEIDILHDIQRSRK